MKSRQNRPATAGRGKKQKFKLENIARVRLRKRWQFELDYIAPFVKTLRVNHFVIHKRRRNLSEPTNLRGHFSRLDCFSSRAYRRLLFFGGGGCGGAFAYDFKDGFGILGAVVMNLFAEMGDEGAGVLPSNTTMRTAGSCATAYGGGPSTEKSEVKNRTLQKPKSAAPAKDKSSPGWA